MAEKLIIEVRPHAEPNEDSTRHFTYVAVNQSFPNGDGPHHGVDLVDSQAAVDAYMPTATYEVWLSCEGEFPGVYEV